MSDIDINKVAAEIASKYVDSVVSSVGGFATRQFKYARRKLVQSIPTYIGKLANHYSRAQTFFFRDSNTPLYNYFVPLDLEIRNTRLKRVGLTQIKSVTNNAVIEGRAGCGKSTLMRHLLISSIQHHHNVPIFVELNRIDVSNPSIFDAILKSLARFGLKMDHAELSQGIAKGRYVFFFDGLDEVSDELRSTVLTQIQELSTIHEDNITLISTRPDETIQPQGFQVLKVCQLSLEQSTELVSKLPFEESIKLKFIYDLKKDLYHNHRTFLANPLLLSIMLLTYGQSASIPSKTSIFFQQAYETLFQTHDAYKGGFSRKRKTSLDVLEFQNAFSAFCAITFDKQKTTFSHSECIEFATQAKAMTGIEFDAKQFITDCKISCCLLMDDGLLVTFVHRAFQEYFTAKLISRLSARMQNELLNRYCDGLRNNIHSILYEIDKEALEANWLIPTIDLLRSKLGVRSNLTKSCYRKYLKLMFAQITMMQESLEIFTVRMATGHNPIFATAARLVYQHYQPKQSIEYKTGTVVDIDIGSMTKLELDMLSKATSWIVGFDFLKFLLNIPAVVNEASMSRKTSISELLNIGTAPRLLD